MTTFPPLFRAEYGPCFEAQVHHLKHIFGSQGITKVAIWGCAQTGLAAWSALQAAGIQVTAAYDTSLRGEFQGLQIQNPHQHFDSKFPVIIASGRKANQLQSVVRFLETRKASYFFSNPKAQINLDLTAFVGRHRGQRAFVVGNGPSLNQIDMTRIKDEVVFGANRVYYGFEKWGFQFPYWTIEDKMVAEDIAAEWNALSGPTKFIPNDLLHLVTHPQDVCAVPFQRIPFEGWEPPFSTNPNMLFWGGTVTVLMLQLAALMGCNPIYLIGVDFSYTKPDHVTSLEKEHQWQSNGDDPNHFFKEYFGKGRKWHDPRVDQMEIGFQAAQQALLSQAFQVCNATPNSKLNVFPKIDFNRIFD